MDEGLMKLRPLNCPWQQKILRRGDLEASTRLWTGKRSGRMLAVECIDVDTAAESQVGTIPAQAVQRVLEADLKRCAITGEDEGRHVFCYESVICSGSRVYLRSTSSVIGSLASLQKDFERLHPLAIKQYVYQIVRGLHELHKVGISCGGLSLSSVLLCGGNLTKVAAWFPSTQASKTLQSQGILSDRQFHRSTFSLQGASDEFVQDVRSVAYVMVEMLTGLRVHGSLMEKRSLLSKVALDSPEHQFLSNVLALIPLKDLLAHPYFSAVSPERNQVLETTPEQRHIVGILTNQELIKCQTLEHQYLQQIRAWHTQFEKKYRRKPKPVDRPGGIVRLQGRCQALKERMEELNNRSATSHGSDYQMIAVDDTPQTQHEDQEKFVDGEAGSPVASEGSRSDLFDRSGGNRSPAQKAFLNRFGSPQ